MPSALPPAHPVPELSTLLCARPRAANRVLLEADPNLRLTYNARGALYEIGRALREAKAGRDEVLMPGFHCPSGVTPLIEAGLRPVFYRVCPDLCVDWNDLLSKVGPRTRAVVVVHYFGFATDLTPLQVLRQQGIALVEDWSHAFLRLDVNGALALPPLQGDAQVFSFWKLVACGVGGGLRQPSGGERSKAWPRPQPPWRERVVRFKRELEATLEHSPHQRTHQAFQAVERWRTGMSPVGKRDQEPPATAVARPGEDHYGFDPVLARAGMPGGARRRLLGADLPAIVQRRRSYFAMYASALPTSDALQPLQAKLDAATCPWVFPLRVPQRDRFDHGWRAQGVALHTFGIWLHSSLRQADARTRGDADQLASELLCLAVHQGLTSADIQRGIEVLGAHGARLTTGGRA